MVMEIQSIIVVGLALLGLVLGSFVGASLWRLRAAQLKTDAVAGEKVRASDKRRVAKLQQKSITKDRSVCLYCGNGLRWYDLVPLISWISLRGKCRYCHKPIGWFEPLIELGLAAFFVMSFLFWPYILDTPLAVVQFVIWLVAGIGLALLFAYDMKWFLLPDVVTLPLIGIGAIHALLVIVSSTAPIEAAVNVLGSCLVLSGLYYAIYVLSGKQWVGFGDVKLGLALGLLLADWQLAILALFLANLIGTLVILPALVTRKLKKGTHIPFGPLLISGWALAGIFGADILGWYLGLVLGVW